jgi:hypothetical protein
VTGSTSTRTSAGTIRSGITRGDIEAKFREIRQEVDDAAGSAKNVAIAVGALVAVAVVGLAFWSGKRRGRKATTVVEVRRY